METGVNFQTLDVYRHDLKNLQTEQDSWRRVKEKRGLIAVCLGVPSPPTLGCSSTA